VKALELLGFETVERLTAIECPPHIKVASVNRLL